MSASPILKVRIRIEKTMLHRSLDAALKRLGENDEEIDRLRAALKKAVDLNKTQLRGRNPSLAREKGLILK